MLRSPFPYFGGKSRVASEVWRRFGSVRNYVEPFAGSLAVLLGRPEGDVRGRRHEDDWGQETVNDADGLLSNFWRALVSDPEGVAYHADWPVNEADLHARHLWLVNQKEDLTSRLMADPEWYDIKAAGWWVWGASAWIGSGWCSGEGAWHAEDGIFVKRGEDRGEEEGVCKRLPDLYWPKGINSRPQGEGRGVNRQMPHLSRPQGVNRQMPHLSRPQGVNRQMPHLSWAQGVLRTSERRFPGTERGVINHLMPVAQRIKNVRVACGDWTRVMGPSVTYKMGDTAIFLDPPYPEGKIDYNAGDRHVYQDVQKWALENGDNPRLRIAVCGYEDDHKGLERAGWSVFEWKAGGGYGSQGDKEGRENSKRERIWFSPHCLNPEQEVEAMDFSELF